MRTTKLSLFLRQWFKKNQSEFSFLVPIIILCLALVVLWFRDGLFLGYAENEATWYRPNGAFLYVWIQNIAAGKDLLYSPPGILDASVNFFLSNYISAVARQAALFFTILVTGGLSVFILTRDALARTFSQRERSLSGMIAAFFYILNPYSMTVIWKRFIYANFFAFALFPLTLMLFERAIATGKSTKYAVLTSLASVSLAFAFTITGYLVTYWILISGWAAFRFLISKRPERFHALRAFAMLVPVWAAFNAWWLAPSVLGGKWQAIQMTLSGRADLGGYGPATFLSRQGNLATATVQSLAGGGIEYVMRLAYGDTSGYAPFKLWGSLYQNPLLILLTFFPLSCVALSLLLNPRNRTFLTFGVLVIFGTFWANGANAPSGVLFVFLFKNIDILQPLRAPFELGGIILALSTSFFVGTGIRKILSLGLGRPSRIFIRGLVLLLLTGTFLIYPLPMWSGATFVDVFSPPQNPLATWKYANIEVPSYYAQTNAFLDKDNSEFRILQLPLSYTGGMEYIWPHPYQGGDPSDTLFDKPSIVVAAAYGGPMDNIMSNLVDFMGSSPNLWKVLSLLNVKYVVLHSDANTTAIKSPPVEQMRQFLTEVQVPSTFQLQKQFENLIRPGWTSVWGNTTVTFTPSNAASSILTMEGTPDGNGLFGSRLSFENPANWGHPIGFQLSLETNATGNLIVQAWDKGGNGIVWYRTLNKSSQVIDLPAQNPDDSFVKPGQSFTFGNVSSVLVGLTNQPAGRLRVVFSSLSVSFYPVVADGMFPTSGTWNRLWANNSTLSRVSDPLGLTVSVAGLPTPTAGFGLWYNVGEDRNWSGYNFLSFQLKSNVTGPLLVQLYDKLGNAFFWDGRFNPDFRIKDAATWQNFTLNLDLPMQVPFQNRLDLQSIDRILIAWVGQGGQAQTFSVRYLSVSRGSLQKVEGISYVTTFGQLGIYKVGDNYFGPLFLSQTNVTTVDDYVGLFNLLRGPYDPGNSIVLIRSQLDPALLSKLSRILATGSQPSIEFQKVDPTKYIVHVKNATSPFVVLFDAEFNTNWLAVASGQEISQSNHFVANGYANAWYLEKTGSYDIVISYYGQTLFWYGTIFSVVSLAAIISYLLVKRRSSGGKPHESDFVRSLPSK
jgi:hypothetical protein